MPNSRIFYLRVCFVLFINVLFSNAHRVRITNPSGDFASVAVLHSLFIQAPGQRDFDLHAPTKPMFLALHSNRFTLSFWESDAPYTFLTFEPRQVNFELMYAQTMLFSVSDGNQLWQFRCIFATDEKKLDAIYSHLSIGTGRGPVEFRMKIDKVESYVKMDHMQNPFIEAVRDLQPAMLHDQRIGDSDRIFSITRSTAGEAERKIPRLVFRSGNFEVRRVESVVVLKFSLCTNWFYIFFFRNTRQASKFMEYLAPTESLILSPDVKSYVETPSIHTPLGSQNNSESESEGSQSEAQTSSINHELQPLQLQQMPQTSDQPQLDDGFRELNDRINKRYEKMRRRTTFTHDQLRRLEEELDKNLYPDDKRRKELATELRLMPDSVKFWFQNRRSKLRRNSAASASD